MAAGLRLRASSRARRLGDAGLSDAILSDARPGNARSGEPGLWRRLTCRTLLAGAACTALALPALSQGAQAPAGIVADAAGAQAELAVSGPSALGAALARATGGEIIALAPGDYGTLALTAPQGVFANKVTLRSADPAQPARFTRIALRGARNIALENLAFHYVPRAGDGTGVAMLEVRGSAETPASDITVSGCSFAGEPAAPSVGADPLDAAAVAAQKGLVSGAFSGRAIYMNRAERVTVSGNRATGVFRGFGFEKLAALEVTGNLLHDIRSDGMTFGELTDARIEANVLHALHPWRHDAAQARGDHPDLIQFWTTNSEAATRNVLIRGNLLVQRVEDGGLFAQGLFMRNPKAEADAQGEAFFYRDIRIEDNVIYNGHINSLVVGETLGLTVSGNLLLADPRAGDRKIETPILSIARRSRDVTVRGNTLPELSRGYATIRGYAALQEGRGLGWQVTDNRFTHLDRAGDAIRDESGAELYQIDKLMDEIGRAVTPEAGAESGLAALQLLPAPGAPACLTTSGASISAPGCL